MARKKAAPAMRVSTRAFHVPKRGGTEEEYEDAYFPDEFSDEVGMFRCAVADGASESAFSDIWAQLLVRGFGSRKLRIADLQTQWQNTVGGKRLPWFLEKKAKKGAFAALIGLSIRVDGAAGKRGRIAEPVAARLSAADWMQPPRGNGSAAAATPATGWKTEAGFGSGKVAGTWRALAIGDSCLFHVRNDELVTVGPVCASAQFDNSPYLLGSKSQETIRRDAEHVSVHAGTWSRGDRFYLATDAISQWLLFRQENDMPPWEMLRELGAEDTRAFDELVAEMRAEHDLHNDDTTLLRVEVD